MTVKALHALERYSWPGNVRELEHEVKRLAYLCADRQAIDSTMLAERLLRSATPRETGAGEIVILNGAPRSGKSTIVEELEDHVRAAERKAIRLALERAGGSQRQAARLLDISRNTLARKIQRLGIEVTK